MSSSHQHYVIRLLVVFLTALPLVGCGKSDETKTDDQQAALQTLLPGTSGWGKYTMIDTVRVFPRGTVWDYLGQISDKYLYNGFQQITTATYAANEDAKKLTLELMEFDNPRHAFGVYTYFRSYKYDFIDIKTDAYLHNDTLVFLKGKYIGRVLASPGLENRELIEGAGQIAGKIAEEAPYPDQVAIFPRDGMIPHSETVSLDDFQGPDMRSDIFGASYIVGSDTIAVHFRFGVPDGPTLGVSQFIGDKGSIKEYLLEGGHQSLLGRDKTGKPIYIANKNDLLVVVIGFSDKALAQTMVTRILENAETYKNNLKT